MKQQKDEPGIRLIAGLGNPESQYARTRHNLGATLLGLIASKYKIELRNESRFQGLLGRGRICGQDVRLVFPQTFMNESGRCVGALCTFYKIPPRSLLVLHDDLDLQPGYMKLKPGGGFAGHNGLKSISACLGGTQDFWRMKIGIGMPPGKSEVISWVLGRPSEADRLLLGQALDCAADAMDTLFSKGFDRAVSQINSFRPEVPGATPDNPGTRAHGHSTKADGHGTRPDGHSPATGT